MSKLFQKRLTYERRGLMLKSQRYWHTKDPCPVYDGKTWHIFGSGGQPKVEIWNIMHATAPNPEGPWRETDTAVLETVIGHYVAAPGVIFDPDDKKFHMFVQKEFSKESATIDHLISSDGDKFALTDSCLAPTADDDAFIYDPHPAIINEKKYIVYSGSKELKKTPDLYLAVSQSGTWDGPWTKKGQILSHENIIQNDHFDPADYEWGLEGSQLVQLPGGKVLMISVLFHSGGEFGKRQRVFFSAARKPEGPYVPIGPVIEPYGEDWESGENGHAAALVQKKKLYLYYQSRTFSPRNRWCFGLVEFDIDEIDFVVNNLLDESAGYIL